MSIYNLPAVDHRRIRKPDQSGVWLPASDISGLADDLSIERAPIATEGVKSIPDAWAQIKLFGQALADPSHEAYLSTRRQWRALLALFALQPSFENDHTKSVYTLDISNTRLSDNQGGAQRLRAVLDRLRPRQVLVPQLDWKTASVITFHSNSSTSPSAGASVAVGLLSPWTIVAASRGFEQLIDADVPWLRDGVADPIEAEGLSNDQWAILEKFLNGLLGALPSGQASPLVRQQLDAMARELKAFAKLCNARAVDALELRDVEMQPKWPAAFYAQLGRASVVDNSKIPEGYSEARLKLRETRGAFKSVVLIDDALTETLGKRAESIRVWEGYTLAQARAPHTFDNIRSAAAKAGHLVLRPDDLIVDRLVRLDGNAQAEAHGPTLANYLLPLTPLALLFLAPEALASGASLTQRGASSEFRLRVELLGDNGLIEHRISKVYDDASTPTAEAPADLALWPDFQSEGWPWTFLRFKQDPRSGLQTRFAASAKLILAEIGLKEEPALRHRAALDWAKSMTLDRTLQEQTLTTVRDKNKQKLIQRLQFAKLGDVVGEQQLLPLGAEAVFFSLQDGTRKQLTPAGCVAVVRKTLPINKDRATVAIDFGTTNTISYCDYLGAPAHISFKRRAILPIRRQDEENVIERLGPTYTDFFPLNPHETPFPTILKRREFEGAGNAEFAYRSRAPDDYGVEDNIFFAPRPGNSSNPELLFGLITQGLLVSNIKWAKEGESRDRTFRFLRQLMIMISAETAERGVAPGSIDWRFSYPQAFNDNELSQFEQTIKDAQDELLDDGLAAKAVATQPPQTLTEGEAAFRYFSNDDQHLSVAKKLILMLDIGGGTTDVAIWRHEELLWSGSFKIAGGDFFTNFLVANPQVLEPLDEAASRHLSAGITGGTEAPRQFVELLVTTPEFRDAFAKAFPRQSGAGSWEALRQCAMTALGGMLHYMGLVLRAIADTGVLTNTDLSEMTIALGGRGSEIFRHIKLGGDLDKLCRIAAVAAGRPADKVAVESRFSVEPKHEVARGLLRDAPPPLAKPKKPSHKRRGPPQEYEGLPAGEVIISQVDAQQQASALLCDVRDLPPASLIERADLGELQKFLRELSELTGVRVRLDEGSAGASGALGIIRAAVAKSLRLRPPRTMGEDDSDTQAIEPPFVSGLRHLVTLMARPEAERAQTMKVKG